MANPPSLVLRPRAGTVLVWCGGLTHAGQPVVSGERSVLVASLSRVSATAAAAAAAAAHRHHHRHHHHHRPTTTTPFAACAKSGRVAAAAPNAAAPSATASYQAPVRSSARSEHGASAMR